MSGTRPFVRLDTGFGPIGEVETPIELHGADGGGRFRLTLRQAETLAAQLRTAAHAVRVLTGKTPVSVPTATGAYAKMVGDWCGKCGAIMPRGYDCRSINCPKGGTADG